MAQSHDVRPAAAPAPGHAPAAVPASAGGLKESLKGKPYATQAAMVSPDGGAGSPGKKHGPVEQATQGPAVRLPHADRIQKSFGKHDIGDVQAYIGGDAAKGNEAMGAHAFATGNQIAFKTAPDLHTAAHEAAHVVQQRQGGKPAGGMGKAGDTYEQHADKVADLVVKGESAEALLDRAPGAGGGKGGGVQFLHGDVDHAKIHPELVASAGGAKTVREAVDQKFGGAARDENFNNKLKVDFESRLAALILGNAQWVDGPVKAVSQKILAYLKNKATANKSDLNADLLKIAKNLGGTEDKPNQVFFGRLADRVPPEKLVADGSIERLLHGEGSLPQQLFAQHQFMDNVWHADGKGDYWQERKAELLGIAERVAPKQLRRGAASSVTDAATGKTSVAKDVFGERFVPEAESAGMKDFASPEDYRKKAGMAGTTEAHSGRNGRERFDAKSDPDRSRAKEVFGNPHGTTTGAASGIYARNNEGGEVNQTLGVNTKQNGAGENEAHSRGVDRLTMDEEGLFIQQARVVLDMPLAGGVSGTTTDLMECAKIFGLAPDQTWLYAVAVLGHLEGAGGHSFHEIATAAKTAGIAYRPGDYRSFLPKSVLGQGEVQALFGDSKYKDVPGIGAMSSVDVPALDDAGEPSSA